MCEELWFTQIEIPGGTPLGPSLGFFLGPFIIARSLVVYSFVRMCAIVSVCYVCNLCLSVLWAIVGRLAMVYVTVCGLSCGRWLAKIDV